MAQPGRSHHVRKRGSAARAVTGVLLAVAISLAVVAGGCRPKQAPPAPTYVQRGDTVVSSTGLRWIDVIVGSGAEPVSRKRVTVHWTGRLTSGLVFGDTRTDGGPLSVVFGVGEVIRGWDEGLATMRAGGRRTLIVPPELAYGDRSVNRDIPPNSTMIYDIELLEAER